MTNTLQFGTPAWDARYNELESKSWERTATEEELKELERMDEEMNEKMG